MEREKVGKGVRGGEKTNRGGWRILKRKGGKEGERVERERGETES